MSGTLEPNSAGKPAKKTAVGARSFRWTCPHCRTELTALLAEVQTVKSCDQCGKNVRVPRPPVGINVGEGGARLPIGLIVETKLESVPLSRPEEPTPAVPLSTPTKENARASVEPTPGRVVDHGSVRPSAISWVVWGALIAGLCFGGIGYLALAGWRQAQGAGGTATIAAELALVQTQWRLAEIARERIEQDYRVTLELYKMQQKNGANLVDRIDATQKAIALEEAKITACVHEIAGLLLPWLARFRRDERWLDQAINEASGATGTRSMETLTRIKELFQQAPAERERGPEYLKQGLTRQLSPK